MRKIIAALQVSLDGYIEGAAGQLDWIESWDDCFDLMPRVDACLLGAHMYPGYEEYWSAILADPTAVHPFSGKPPTDGEIAYANFASRTPHYVLSTTLDNVAWVNSTILRSIDEVRQLKQQQGKDIHAIGGALLVSSLLNAGLLDEIQLVIHPVLLGTGKPLFQALPARHRLRACDVLQLAGERVKLSYSCT